LPPLEGYAWKIGIARIELVNGLFGKIDGLYYFYYVLVGLHNFYYVLVGLHNVRMGSGDNYMKG
jgi:uncharacterized membrane protein YuzA (DUF378 family)